MKDPDKKKPVPAKKTVKKQMRSSGASLYKLAKATGTTKEEVKALFRQTARNLTTDGVSKSDTRKLEKALSGGKMAGKPRTSANVKKAKAVGTTLRKQARKVTGGK